MSATWRAISQCFAQMCFASAGVDNDSQAIGMPLPEGGIRFAIHPVSGLLTTSQSHVSARDTSAASWASHRPQRVDKFIIKVTTPWCSITWCIPQVSGC